MPVIAMSDVLPADLEVDALVVGMFAGTDRRTVLAPGAESLDAATGGRLAESFALLDASGSAGEVTRLVTFGSTASPVVLAVGLGPQPPRDQPAAPDDPAPSPLWGTKMPSQRLSWAFMRRVRTHGSSLRGRIDA